MKKLLIAIPALLFAALFVYLIYPNWGPSVHADELLLTYWALVVIAGICGLSVAWIGWILARGFAQGRLGFGAIPLSVLAVLAVFLLFRLHTTIPQALRLRNQVMDCHETNMGLIFHGIRRYWKDHDGKNPPGTGPHGKLTQADWQRVLLRYRGVWKDLKDSNGKPFTLLKCPADKSKRPCSYEINTDLQSPVPVGEWIVRENWDPTLRYHQGYAGVLFQNKEPDDYYIMPIRSN